MYLQSVDNVYDLAWARGVSYGEVHKQSEQEYSRYHFELADTALFFDLFDKYEGECLRLVGGKHGPADGPVLAAYDFCMKASHAFNVLDARGAISVTERQRFIGRVRAMARACAEAFLHSRAERRFPLLGAEVGERAYQAYAQAVDEGLNAAAKAAARAATEAAADAA